MISSSEKCNRELEEEIERACGFPSMPFLFLIEPRSVIPLRDNRNKHNLLKIQVIATVFIPLHCNFFMGVEVIVYLDKSGNNNIQ